MGGYSGTHDIITRRIRKPAGIEAGPLRGYPGNWQKDAIYGGWVGGWMVVCTLTI